MQNNKFRNCLQMLSISLVMALVTTACFKEDFSQCQISIEVKAFTADGTAVDGKIVRDVTLYLFDKDKRFIVSGHTTIGEVVTFKNVGKDNLFIVSWGNGKQGGQSMPDLKIGDHLETAFVSLIGTRAALPVVGSPDDLFYGITEITPTLGSTQSISLKRKTASVAITTRYLKEYVGDTEGEFRYVLRKSSDKLDFYGKSNGVDVSYSPTAVFDNNGDFVSSVFNKFAADHDLRIDIYHRDILKTTVISDSQGKPLRAVEGRLLNVLIDFKSNIDVEVSVTPWGAKQIWKEL